MMEVRLLKHKQEGNFHYFRMQGVNGNYSLTVIKAPDTFGGYSGWTGDSHYIAINENRNTGRSSHHSYVFHKHYFSSENIEYLPHRLGIYEEDAEDFMNCVSQFVHPVI